MRRWPKTENQEKELMDKFLEEVVGGWRNWVV